MTPKTVFQVEDIFSLPGKGTVVVGILKKGAVQKGMKTKIKGIEAEVLSIQQFRKTLDILQEPESVAGLLLSNVRKEDITPGDFLYFE